MADGFHAFQQSRKAGDMPSRLAVLIRHTRLGRAAASEARAAENLVDLIRRANESVYIVCGGLNPTVYGNGDLLDAVRSAKAPPRNVVFHILVGPDEKDGGAEMKELLKGSITVSKKRPPLHFAVVDNRHVRYEGVHQAQEPVPANDVLLNAPKSAEKLIKIYYSLISDSENILELADIEKPGRQG